MIPGNLELLPELAELFGPPEAISSVRPLRVMNLRVQDSNWHVQMQKPDRAAPANRDETQHHRSFV
jgi:hypothetical protein